MGFERLCMAIQGVTSNYDTDVFQPMIRSIGQMAGKTYGQDRQTDIAMRVIADHIGPSASPLPTDSSPPTSGPAT